MQSSLPATLGAAALCLALACIPAPGFAQSAQMRTEYLMTLHAPLQPPQVANTDLLIFGMREGGTVDGPRVKGKIVPPAGDWLRRMPNGSSRLDVRLTVQTDDGALIYVEYGGVAKFSKETAERLAKGETIGPEDAYFITAPRFQTSAEKYAWLNDLQAVGRMVSLKRGEHIRYEIFAVR